MNNRLQTQRIGLYLFFSFGLAWLISLIIYLTGGLADSRELFSGIPLALPLLVVMMWMPAVANILTRLITKEGKEDLWLRPNLRGGWRYYLLAWLAPALLTILGGALYFALNPNSFDPTSALFAQQIESTGQTLPFPVSILILIQIGIAFFIAPFINMVATFGEEFGWRAYLQPKLMPLGKRKAMLLMGLIWGLWHAPVIAMGHNYGFDYPGAPWSGILMMCWFTFVCGSFIGWLTLREGSVWPATLGHGAINAVAGISAIFLATDPSPLLGPLPVGFIGSIGFLIATILVWFRMGDDAPQRVESEIAGMVDPT